jgi:predicted aminopeptidase
LRQNSSSRYQSSVKSLFLVLAAASLAGCATVAWYGQAARGQIEVLAKREDIADLIADPATDPALRSRLETVLEMRRFAVEALGLPDGRSYTLYADLERDAPLWNVVATPAHSVEPRTWCYPLVGCLAYRGFFERRGATRLADRLAGQGLDAAVFPATAYSTLGWFADPVLDSMLRLSDADLAELIFHELTHERLYVAGDTAFNEAYATFVGRLGAARWLSSTGHDAALAAWRRDQRLDQGLRDLLLETRRRLSEGFETAADESAAARLKTREFERLRRRIGELARSHDSAALEAWLERPLNNAHLALVATYEAGVGAFERLFHEECGEELRCLHERAAALARAGAPARRAFLESGH